MIRSKCILIKWGEKLRSSGLFGTEHMILWGYGRGRRTFAREILFTFISSPTKSKRRGWGGGGVLINLFQSCLLGVFTDL